MRHLLLGFALVVGLSVGLSAQSTETKTNTKIKVKEGKSVTVTGCVQSSADRSGYILTEVSGSPGTASSYHLVGGDLKELGKHVGHRVEITGKAADQDHGRLQTETKTEVRGTGGDTKKTEAKGEVEGNLQGLPFLGVKEIKMISAACS
jgi:hypothetical protein